MKQTPSSALSTLGARTQDPPIAWLMRHALEKPGIISLAAGFTDNPSLPVEATRELVARVLSNDESGRAALQYGTGAGDPNLRELTANWLRRHDNAPDDSPGHQAQRLLITHGSQQLLYLVAEALFDESDIVLVEDPTYFVYLGIAQSRAIQCRGVRMTEDGIDIAHLEQVLKELQTNGALKRVKALYLVTYFQNPTGINTTLERKRAALEVLEKYEDMAGHPIFLIEDAAYRELRFAGDDEPSALTLEHAPDRVIYTGTFSKPFATGIRVGFGILPAELARVLLRLKGNHDFGTSNILQQILAAALETGAYANHLEKLRQRYRAKAEVMLQALKQHCGGLLTWREPKGGLYVWASTPRTVTTGLDSECFRVALDKELLYVPGQLCYAADPARQSPNHEMRLSFGSASEDNIRQGIERLGGVIQALEHRGA